VPQVLFFVTFLLLAHSIAASFPTSVQFFHLQKQKGGRLTTRTAGSTNAVVRAQFVPTFSFLFVHLLAFLCVSRCADAYG